MIPNRTYRPSKLRLKMSEFRQFIEEGDKSKTFVHSFCLNCNADIIVMGKWCLRNEGVECVPTNEYHCHCGCIMTPGDIVRNASLL